MYPFIVTAVILIENEINEISAYKTSTSGRSTSGLLWTFFDQISQNYSNIGGTSGTLREFLVPHVGPTRRKAAPFREWARGALSQAVDAGSPPGPGELISLITVDHRTQATSGPTRALCKSSSEC